MSGRLIVFGVLLGIVSGTRRLLRLLMDETDDSSGRSSIPPRPTFATSSQMGTNSVPRSICTTCRFTEMLNSGIRNTDDFLRLNETLLSGETCNYCLVCEGCPLVSNGSAIVAALGSWWRLFEPLASLFFLPFTIFFYMLRSTFKVMRSLFVIWLFLMTLITSQDQ
uniref:Uncharacterized protein n=1 Tax=Fagus sylvatica TaxID=28930 RepID=A0A2N9F1A0_FAGSY